ncbi:putative galactose oxidase [Rosa chinensis]|uniref:Putative galactose oxidase n=1 Tax=Rosa chinensis TaxID=74649 RepID=A0A2P6R344_ROSCH|nr:aldehyde oxidase GLOX [Rosa chinensis]PRQ40862.1 putative galactose oxidase [Rosa chinensis]
MAIFKNHAALPTVFFYVSATLFSLFIASPDSYFNDMSPVPAPTVAPYDGGQWILLHKSIGVSAMHMQLLKNNKVILFDRTDMGPSNATYPPGAVQCRNYTVRNRTVTDCTPHSLLYDVASDTFLPLVVKSDTWCSSGAVDPNGTLVQTGGYGTGIQAIRTFTPCDDDTCQWVELGVKLLAQRWYATNQILPDGRVIVVGGRRAFNYEFYPKADDKSSKLYTMRFLWETTDFYEENNLYPFLHLLPDGNLFVFANNRSILFDYNNNTVVKAFPVMRGGVKRSYPATGSSVMLPLKMNGVLDGSGQPEVEILICGGSYGGAYYKSNRENVYIGASASCCRIKLSDPNPNWVMEEMPLPRVMGDMLLLPNGDVLILNGAANGTAGWEDAINPVLHPVLYKTYEPDPSRRFVILNPTTIPRMYHSSCLLLPDGRILVGGSNPHQMYNFRRAFPTELSLEAYIPPYLSPSSALLRPTIISIEAEGGNIVSYGQEFSVNFGLSVYRPGVAITVALVSPSFTTHSLAMNQRVVVLEVASQKRLSVFDYKITARGPPSTTVAPPGYYMIFIVHAGVPGQALWVKVQ